MKSIIASAAAAALVGTATAIPISEVTHDLVYAETSVFKGELIDTVTGIITADYRDLCGDDIDEELEREFCGFVIQTPLADESAEANSTHAILVRPEVDDLDGAYGEGYKVTLTNVVAGVQNGHPLLQMNSTLLSSITVDCDTPTVEVHSNGKLCEEVRITDTSFPMTNEEHKAGLLMLTRVSQDTYMQVDSLDRIAHITLTTEPVVFQPTQVKPPGPERKSDLDVIATMTYGIGNPNSQSKWYSLPAFVPGFGFDDEANKVLLNGMPLAAAALNATGIKVNYGMFSGSRSATYASITTQSGREILGNYTNAIAEKASMYRAPAKDLPVEKNKLVAGESIIRVSGMNVENYFTTLGNVHNSTRGAYNDFEFQRQEYKIHEAMIQLDAAVFALQEMENINQTALVTFVENLNDRLAARNSTSRYSPIYTGKLGNDVIKCAIIYNPDFVEPVGNYSYLEYVEKSHKNFDRHRPSIAQTFSVVGDDQVRFTVVSNHFKSKNGRDCDKCPVNNCLPDGATAETCDCCDAGDGQANYAVSRTKAAKQLAAWIETNPTGEQTPEEFGSRYLIIGDLNAYRMEDAVTYLTNPDTLGWVDLAFRDLGNKATSYIFDSLMGSLDYILATPEMAELCGEKAGLSKTFEWHSNSIESGIIGYRGFSFGETPYRSSDHDPSLVACKMTMVPPAEESGLFAFIIIGVGAVLLIAALGVLARAKESEREEDFVIAAHATEQMEFQRDAATSL